MPEDYVESLRGHKMEVYYLGERTEKPVDHPSFRQNINADALTYECPFYDVETNMLATAHLHLTGTTINRFAHIHQSAKDLANKVKPH